MKVNVKKRVISSAFGIIVGVLLLKVASMMWGDYFYGCQLGSHSRCHSLFIILPFIVCTGVLFIFKEFYFLFTIAKRFYDAKGYKLLKENERKDRLASKDK
jgi:hypothetical protein